MHLKRAVEQIRALREQGVDLHYPISALDSLLGGLRRRHLITVGAGTSQGKTSFVLNVVLASLRDGKRVVYNGFENPDQVWPRVAALESGIPLDHFLKPYQITAEDWKRVQGVMKQMEQWKDQLLILEGETLEDMGARVKDWGPDVLVLDYIQRYARKFRFGGESLVTHDIGRAMSDFQDLAIAHNAAGIVVSQFRRLSWQEKDQEPQLDWLKDSGEIENMSDAVILLWWKWRVGMGKQDHYEILVAKNKLGEIATITARVTPETMRIEDWGKNEQEGTASKDRTRALAVREAVQPK